MFSASACADVFQDFSGSGTAYYSSINQNTPNNFGVQTDGAFAGMFRLLTNEGNTKNNLYFQNNDRATNSITATFDMYLNGVADGISFSLVNTANYSDLAPLYAGDAAENYGLTGSLTVGFAVYQGNYTRLFKDASNNAVVTANGLIAQGHLMTANVTVNFAPDNSAAYVDISLLDTVNGNYYTIANQTIAGMSPYNSSVLFAGRTGGSAMDAYLDNISVIYNNDTPSAQRWKPGRTGLFTDGDSWENNTAPPANSTALIYGGANTITGGGNPVRINDGVNLLVAGGNTTVNDTNVFIIGDGGSAGTITMNTGTFASSSKVVIGNGNTDTGSVIVNGGHFQVACAELNVIGDYGKGSVAVHGGFYEVTSASHGTVLGYNTNSEGTFTITGGKAKIKNMRVAREGQGTLLVSGGTLSIDDNLQTNEGNGSVGKIEFSGNAVVNIGNHFYPGRVDANGSAVKFDLLVTDNAVLTVGNDLWEGNPGASATPLSGEYVSSLIFSGNSTTSARELWLGISGKSYMRIEENATFTSRGGNAGVGWGNNGTDSLLEMTGGTFNAETFKIGEGRAGIAKFTGGTGNFQNVNLGNTGSVFTIEGDAVVNTNNFNNSGTFNFDGGTLNARDIRFSLTQTGGMLSPDGGFSSLGLPNTGSVTNIYGDYTIGGGDIRLDLFSLTNFDTLNITGDWNITGDITLYLTGFDDLAIGDVFELVKVGDGKSITGLDHIQLADPNWMVGINGDGNFYATRELAEVGSVPEPATWALLATGLLVIGMLRVRKQRCRQTSRV